MNPIGTPVFKPTANCIWQSFLISGKRHLILTGGRKTGKTTLLKQLCPPDAPGITTYAIPQKEVRLKENATGKEAIIGVFDERLPGSENRMRIHLEGFVQLGIQALERCAAANCEWVTLDEIGYLECGCDAYLAAFERLKTAKRLIMTVRKQDLPFLRALREDSEAFCVDLDEPYGKSGCVIMASGFGRRFGGNKLMADFCGEPLFLRTVRATEGVFTKRVVVTRYTEVFDLCRQCGVDAVLHDEPNRNDTVRIGLEAIGEVDRCMFCPADQPLLRRETVTLLALAAANDGQSILRPCHAGEPGSPVVFPAWAFDALKNLPTGKGGGNLIQKHSDKLRLLPVENEYELMDADSREMLEHLRKIAYQSASRI